MVQIQVSERTAEKLHRIAAKKHINLSVLLDQVFEQYEYEEEASLLDELQEKDERLVIIDREQAAYESQHHVLYEKYAGRYIAMHLGKVVDHDVDSSALHQRIRACYGDEPVLITPVLREARQTIIVRSPRLIQGEK